MTSKNRVKKEAKVAEIKEKLEKAQGVVLAGYQGLTVEEDTKLRKTLREAGVEYKVYKNTMTTLAAKELGLDGIVTYLEGPVSIAFSYDDATAAARALNDFAKEHKKLELKAGIVEKKFTMQKRLKLSLQYHQEKYLLQNYLEASSLHYQILLTY